ncbi:MAG: DNA mismatch repair protein MutS [Nitrosospira sp. 56-18]|jgi:DNA-nicking Smr family endonuclease|nr:Smr/MutS family protein [Nitrosospira sp.]OJY11895.1 MAG: DNA mismatch repair protein MutS [Nitrosospira sp. 56-18]
MKKRERKPAAELPADHIVSSPGVGNDDAVLFRDAIRGVAPLADSGRMSPLPKPHPLPIPRQAPGEPPTGHGDMLSDFISLEIAAGDEWSFMRPGISRQTLRRLRRGYWSIEAQLDLHGYTRDQARMELAHFLDESVRHGLRCVRVIHGKGRSSRNGEPVLRARVGSWLSQRGEVLAFCQAKPEDGGSGAVLVLLKGTKPA